MRFVLLHESLTSEYAEKARRRSVAAHNDSARLPGRQLRLASPCRADLSEPRQGLGDTPRTPRGPCELAWHDMHMATYRETIRTLQPIIAPVFDALQTGLTEAANEHARRRIARQDDPHYYAHLARRVALEELRGQGLQALDEDTGRPLQPLSGLLIPYRGVAARILRLQRNRKGVVEFPIPGNSKKRQEFWRQEPTLPGITETDNILILWEDDRGRLIDPLRIVRPLGGDNRRDSLIMNWHGLLSRQMATMRADDIDLLRPEAEFPDFGTGTAG